MCSYLKKSNKNLKNDAIIIVMYIAYLLCLNLLHTMNTIKNTIVSTICIGNSFILSPDKYVTLNIPLYGKP